MPSNTERHATFRFLRERAPVHYDAELGGWCITRYEDVRKVLAIDPDHHDPPPRRVISRAAEAARHTIAGRADELVACETSTAIARVTGEIALLKRLRTAAR